MDFLQRKFLYYFNTEKKVEKNREISRFEGYLQLIYNILSWDDISLTLTILLLFNSCFWVVVHWELRLLGVIPLCLLVGFIANAYLEVPDQLSESLESLHGDLTLVFSAIKDFRRESSVAFSIVMMVLFVWFNIIGKQINGYLIFYCSMLGVFFLPLIIPQLPPTIIARLKKVIGAVRSDHEVLAEDELIPFIAEKNFNEKDPELESLLTDKTADSVTNSLISGITSMPSYLDAEDSQPFLEEDDLLPQQSNSQTGVSYTPGDLSSDSDSDPKDIRFDPAHFNGDSSSEEEAYTKNLKFPDVTDNTTTDNKAKEQVDKLVSNLLSVASAGSSLMANVIKSVTVPSNPLQKKNSSDSEFEFINSDDVDDEQ